MPPSGNPPALSCAMFKEEKKGGFGESRAEPAQNSWGPGTHPHALGFQAGSVPRAAFAFLPTRMQYGCSAPAKLKALGRLLLPPAAAALGRPSAERAPGKGANAGSGPIFVRSLPPSMYCVAGVGVAPALPPSSLREPRCCYLV